MNQRQLAKIDARLQAEGEKQTAILFPTTAIALKQEFGWGHKRIESFFDEVHDTFEECSDYGQEVSMIQMLDEKVGINLKAEANGKSWNELCFLNHKVDLGNKATISPQQWYLMRIEQIKWVAPAVLASEFIALHERYRFTRPMLQRLQGAIENTRAEYKYNAKKLSDVCFEITGIRMQGASYMKG